MKHISLTAFLVMLQLVLGLGAAHANTPTPIAPAVRLQIGTSVKTNTDLKTNFDFTASATLKLSAPDGRVEAGKSVNAIFSLGRLAPADLELTVASSQPALVRVPPRVTVPRGAMAATFTIETAAGVSSDLTATIRVNTVPPILNVPSLTASLFVLREPQVDSVRFEPAAVTSGQTSVGTITLSRAAGLGGVTVPLRTLDPTILQLPGSVTIASGATSVTFPVVGPQVTQSRTFSIEARLGGIAPFGVLQVAPPPLAITAITLPAQVFAGQAGASGEVTFNRAVGTAFSESITLTSDNANVVVPNAILGRSGDRSARFNISGRNVPAGSPPTSTRITATLGSSSQSATTSLVGPRVVLSTVSVTNLTVASGQTTNGQVSLSTIPLQPVTVALASSNTSLSVPATVTVPAGQASATFPVSVVGLAIGAPALSATLTATLETITRTVLVNIKGQNPVVAGLSIPSTIRSDEPAQTGQVTLAAPSQTDTSVSLLSSFQNLSVPASIAIPAGQTSGSFTLTASGLPEGMSPITATITAATPFPASPIQRATVSVTSRPPALTISSVTFSAPGPLRAPASTTGTVTLSSPAPTGGTTVFLSVVQGRSYTSVSPASISIPSGGSTGTFQVAFTPNILSDASNSPMDAGLACLGARIGAQTSVRGCVSVGK